MINLTNDFVSRIVRKMIDLNYKVFTEDELNIVYIEGANLDGSVNTDLPNLWNDLRTVIQIKDSTPRFLGCWRATTEPGSRYTQRPMNPKGAARIAFNQYKAWSVGIHGNSEPHEALVQVAPVTVHRDLNKDYFRTGDRTDTGLFGINQHWGGDANTVGSWSAGCLVGQSRLGHREFMRTIKGDSRYKANTSYVFWTTILDGSKL